MNVYDDFFENINPEAWEFFATDFLSSMGYSILIYPSRGSDDGLDALVELNAKKYVVSCKNFTVSNRAVGVSDENSILDRIVQHGAVGFIGFYSTLASSSLTNRLFSFQENGYECAVFDKSRISDFLPRVSSYILQKYGIPNDIRYVLNVDEYSYRPLPCLGCGVDILSSDLINRSMVCVVSNSEELDYLYGCKNCIGGRSDIGWAEVNQVLHQEQLNSWIGYVESLLDKHQPSSTFYKHKSEFEGGIQQRMFPSNWGRWLAPS